MPYDLIRDYSHLLMAFTCADDIDHLAYQEKANDWLQRFHSNDDINFNWPSVTVHCLLEHGGQVGPLAEITVSIKHNFYTYTFTGY